MNHSINLKNIYLLIYSAAAAAAKPKPKPKAQRTKLYPHPNQFAKYAYHKHYENFKELSSTKYIENNSIANKY